ncbi:MAG: hypothetical protein J2P16_00230 [Mycobacterium sp.]|nr:hypothetical protein [Mycobacterium sp.]
MTAYYVLVPVLLFSLIVLVDMVRRRAARAERPPCPAEQPHRVRIIEPPYNWQHETDR